MAFPLTQEYAGSGGSRARLVVFLIQVFWHPIGAIISGLFGLFMLFAVFSKSGNEKQGSHPTGSQAPGISDKPIAQRLSVVALMSDGKAHLSTDALQKALHYLNPAEPVKAEAIEFPAPSTGGWLTRARFGVHAVRLTGIPEPLSQKIQLETLYHSLSRPEWLEPMGRHRAQIVLQYERGTDNPAEQMQALHVVASALLGLGLLGIVDEGATNAIPSAELERNFQTRELLLYGRLLPINTFTGVVQKVLPDGRVWFASRGHERFGAPNFAYRGTSNEAGMVTQHFNDLLNYIYRHKVVIEAGHTTELSEHFVRFAEPQADESFLVDGNTTTLTLLPENESQPTTTPPSSQTVSEERVSEQTGSGQTVSTQTPLAPAAAYRPLGVDELEWIDRQTQHAERILMGFSGQDYAQPRDPAGIVADLTASLEPIRARGYSREQLHKLALPFGLLCGSQVVRAHGYLWARPSADRFVVYTANVNSLDPVEMMRGVFLENDDGLKLSATFNLFSPQTQDAAKRSSSLAEDAIPGLRLGLN